MDTIDTRRTTLQHYVEVFEFALSQEQFATKQQRDAFISDLFRRREDFFKKFLYLMKVSLNILSYPHFCFEVDPCLCKEGQIHVLTLLLGDQFVLSTYAPKFAGIREFIGGLNQAFDGYLTFSNTKPMVSIERVYQKNPTISAWYLPD
ncbi:hypothetical protein KC901_01805 [Patescibacteria group bacterium]|nr:hypothetical protein [Patescibacteria group bacterium]